MRRDSFIPCRRLLFMIFNVQPFYWVGAPMKMFNLGQYIGYAGQKTHAFWHSRLSTDLLGLPLLD